VIDFCASFFCAPLLSSERLGSITASSFRCLTCSVFSPWGTPKVALRSGAGVPRKSFIELMGRTLGLLARLSRYQPIESSRTGDAEEEEILRQGCKRAVSNLLTASK
jgi:hypothetical protein